MSTQEGGSRVARHSAASSVRATAGSRSSRHSVAHSAAQPRESGKVYHEIVSTLFDTDNEEELHKAFISAARVRFRDLTKILQQILGKIITP